MCGPAGYRISDTMGGMENAMMIDRLCCSKDMWFLGELLQLFEY